MKALGWVVGLGRWVGALGWGVGRKKKPVGLGWGGPKKVRWVGLGRPTQRPNAPTPQRPNGNLQP